MTDSDKIDCLGGTAAVARRLGVAPASVSEWRRNGIPDGRLIELGAELERLGVTPRWELRPLDWHLIWPELIGAKGVPQVPEALEARAA